MNLKRRLTLCKVSFYFSLPFSTTQRTGQRVTYIRIYNLGYNGLIEILKAWKMIVPII